MVRAEVLGYQFPDRWKSVGHDPIQQDWFYETLATEGRAGMQHPEAMSIWEICPLVPMSAKVFKVTEDEKI